MESTERLQPGTREQENAGPVPRRNGTRQRTPYRIGDPAPDEGRRVSKQEYLARWYENPYPDIDISYEWNNGILEAKPLPTPPQLDLYNWFLNLLQRHIATFRSAALINLETGFELKMPDPTQPSGQKEAIRKPDIGVILDTNPIPWGRFDQRHYEGVCDLVVEAVSDSTAAEVLRDTQEKRVDYARSGVKEYYILDPNGEHMRFYRLASNDRYRTIPEDEEGVIRSEVMEGLRFRLEDLYRKPDLEELALDPIYNGYVLPGYQILADKAAREALRADGEAQRADQEAQRADEEAQRAEREAAVRQQAEERAAATESELLELRAEVEKLRKRQS